MFKSTVFFAVALILSVHSVQSLHAQQNTLLHGQRAEFVAARTTDDYKKFALEAVSNIHGATGPFAVAGYRIGQRAGEELELLKGSFDWNVEHRTLLEVKWSCVADGIQAATGASLGKLTLKLAPVENQNDVASVFINKKTGRQIVFRLTDSFLQKYLNAPPEKLNELGQTVLDLGDGAIFTMQIVDAGQKPKRNSPFAQKKTDEKASD